MDGRFTMIMKLATLTFLATLLLAHSLNGWSASLGQELSRFRDSDYGSVGYVLFALLIAMLSGMCVKMLEQRRSGHALIFSASALLLVIIGLTPTFDSVHNACAIFLIILLYVYYAVLSYLANPLGCLVYVSVPLILLITVAAQGMEPGCLQKALILYLLLVANIHYNQLGSPIAAAFSRRRAARIKREAAFVDHWLERGVETSGEEVRLARRKPNSRRRAVEPCTST